MDEIKYSCCICKETVIGGSGSKLDPMSVWLVSNIDKNRDEQKEQQFFCHFECFRRVTNDDPCLYIVDVDFPTVGEIDAEIE